MYQCMTISHPGIENNSLKNDVKKESLGNVCVNAIEEIHKHYLCVRCRRRKSERKEGGGDTWERGEEGLRDIPSGRCREWLPLYADRDRSDVPGTQTRM